MAGIPIFSPDPALYPDPTGRADRICRFVRNLRLWEGDFAGRPFHLHGFQEAIVRRIYGPSTPAGARLVRMACIWIPRGNAKTTLAAALGLAHFLGPAAEAGGQVVIAAADRENAGIAFNWRIRWCCRTPLLPAGCGRSRAARHCITRKRRARFKQSQARRTPSTA